MYMYIYIDTYHLDIKKYIYILYIKSHICIYREYIYIYIYMYIYIYSENYAKMIHEITQTILQIHPNMGRFIYPRDPIKTYVLTR